MFELFPLVALAAVVTSLPVFLGLAAFSLQTELLRRVLPSLVALSVGALLGSAFLGLIPETIELSGDATISAYGVLVGMLVFFLLEKTLRWHHHHHAREEECIDHEPHGIDTPHPVAPLVLVADAGHNLLDGIAIAAAFVVDPVLGWTVTLAIFVHEVPQEVSDFALLLHAGWSRARALAANAISALFAVLGGAIGLLLVDTIDAITPLLLAATAGGFIYIAAVDLTPELHRTVRTRAAIVQLCMIIVGVSLVALTGSLTHGH